MMNQQFRRLRRGAARQSAGAVALIAATLSLSGCVAPHVFEVAATYSKREYRIPMRDGTLLFTAVYSPRGTSRTYPILLLRTPYSVSPYGPDQFKDDIGPSPRFGQEGYIFAYQDVRGRFMSEGEFINMRPHLSNKSDANDIDESTDTYDTIEWLIRNVPRNNGRVGMWGISYPGFYAAAGMIDSHPALKAVSPQAPIADWFVGDDFHHNGAFFLFDAFDFFYVFGRTRPAPTTTWPARLEYGTPDAYRWYLDLGPPANANARHLHGEVPFWNEMMQHGTYDEFWRARSLPPHLKNIRAAVMTVGGWFDAEDLYGPLAIYESVERNNPGIQNTLVMGPWSHGGWARTRGDSLGDIHFGSPTSHYYQQAVELPFFHQHLKNADDPFPAPQKGLSPLVDLPEALVFDTGAHRWRPFEHWPPQELWPRQFYFGATGRLLPDEPPSADEAFDEYVCDPARPVPYTAANSERRGNTYMIEDQRYAARRPDVLSYQTAVLSEAVTLVGPIEADLWIETTGSDADFIVKLIDVLPDDAVDPDPNPCGVRMGGYQMLVRWEVMRAKFRDSLEHPAPLIPDEPTRVRFALRDVCHTFRPGHRIMVQVQSSMFPLIDRNPQTFCDIYAASESDFRKATHRVHRSRERPTCVNVHVLVSGQPGGPHGGSYPTNPQGGEPERAMSARIGQTR